MILQDGVLGGIAAVTLFAIAVALAVYSGEVTKLKEIYDASINRQSVFGFNIVNINSASSVTSEYGALIASIDATAVSLFNGYAWIHSFIKYLHACTTLHA